LHLDKALAVSDLAPMSTPQRPAPGEPGRWHDLARTPQFVMQGLRSAAHSMSAQSTDPASLELLVVCSGYAEVESGSQRERLERGGALLLPANLGAYRVTVEGEVLRCAVSK